MLCKALFKLYLWNQPEVIHCTLKVCYSCPRFHLVITRSTGCYFLANCQLLKPLLDFEIFLNTILLVRKHRHASSESIRYQQNFRRTLSATGNTCYYFFHDKLPTIKHFMALSHSFFPSKEPLRENFSNKTLLPQFSSESSQNFMGSLRTTGNIMIITSYSTLKF